MQRCPATPVNGVAGHRICAPGGIRTPNLLIRSQMLYPLSYGRPAETASSMLQAGQRAAQNAADQLGVSLLVTEMSGLSTSTSASPPK